MRVRKTNDITKCLENKGFQQENGKSHHTYFFLVINGIKQSIYTYFSHGQKEYNKFLMNKIKKQLKFKETKDAEEFFDCHMSGDDYVKMLITNKDINIESDEKK